MSEIIVIKIGGSTLGSHDTTIQDIVALQKKGKRLVVVHGGGKIITDWLTKQNIITQFVRGERVTNRASLDVVVAVLAGLVNKELVAAINGQGGRAVGLSGVDGALIEGKIREPEMGFTGLVDKVDTAALDVLLNAGFVPVVAPVGFNAAEKHVAGNRLLNINADLVAGEIAAAVGAEKLVFLTDVVGVLDKLGQLVRHMSSGEVNASIASGVASGGMIPKLNACLKAVSGNGTASIVDGRKPHALLESVEGKGEGTTITNN